MENNNISKPRLTLKQGLKALKKDPEKLLYHEDFSEGTFIFLRPEYVISKEGVSSLESIPKSLKPHIKGDLVNPSIWSLITGGEEVEPIKPKKMFKPLKGGGWNIM